MISQTHQRSQTGPPYEPPDPEVLSLLIHSLGAKRNGKEWLAACPAHEDHTPSLAIRQADDGKILVHCHGGCSQAAVLGTLRDRGLWPEPGSEGPRDSTHSVGEGQGYSSADATLRATAQRLGGTPGGTWIYHNLDGAEAFRVVRIDKPGGRKEYRPVQKTTHGWALGGPSGPLPLYNLPALQQAERVVVLEGEKCVEAARLIGLVATTSAHGANAPGRTDWSPLAGKHVLLLPDNDPAGRRYADIVSQILLQLDPPASVRVVEIPDLPEGGDLADYLDIRDSTDSEDIRRYIEYLGQQTPEVKPADNSIRAPIGRGLARNEFQPPVPASALGEGVEISWVWEGYLASGFVTLLTGLWKAGKTTLEAHLIQAMGEGGELACSVSRGGVLVVAEEGQALWARRRDDLGIGDHAEFDVQPFLGRPSTELWGSYVSHVARLVRSRRYQAVIFDTLASVSPISDENDAARMMAVLTPLRAITEAGAAVLLVHHPRKGDAGEGQASRGSGALPAFVDIVIELRRFDAKNRDDTRRTLTAYSRFDDTPRELVIELTQEGYRACGTKSDASRQDRLKVLEAILVHRSPGLTVAEIHGVWPEGPRCPSLRTIGKDLKAGACRGLWQVTGSGHKGDPLRYRVCENSIRAHPPSIGARNEFDPEQGTQSESVNA